MNRDVAKVLLDLSVRRDGQIGQWTTKSYPVQWGPTAIKSEVAVLGRRPLPRPDERERLESVLCLPTVRRLASDGSISLCTSSELDYESWSGRNPAAGTRGDLFSGVPIASIEAAVERSFFRQTADLQRFLNREYFQEYCLFLLAVTDQQAEYFIGALPDLPASSVRGLRDLSRFRSLCRNAPEKHLPDAFHFWTAELSGCDYFLTMDGKFRRGIQGRCPNLCRFRAVSPSEFLTTLGVVSRDPMPFQPGESLSFLEALTDPATPTRQSGEDS